MANKRSALAITNEDGDANDRSLVDGNSLKKHKPGIPGWHRTQDPDDLVKERYLDYHLYKKYLLCEAVVKHREGRIESTPFYAFSNNVLCKSKNGDFVPLEIGINAYSLEAGKIGDTYHALIDPGEIPIGCVNEARDHSEQHKITFPFESQSEESNPGRTDYSTIYKEILHYTQKGERTLLVADSHDIEQAEKVLKWLYERSIEQGARLPSTSCWSVLPLVDFVTMIDNHIYGKSKGGDLKKFATYYFTKISVDQTAQDHDPEIMCDYHRDISRQTKWCAKSCSTRVISYIEPILRNAYRLQLSITAKAASEAIENSQTQPLQLSAAPQQSIEF